MQEPKKHKIILFDGVCNLCNASINFVIQHDKKDIFRFATLQSEIGKKYLTKFNLDPSHTDSIILIDSEKHYIKSTAALQISKSLPNGYPLLFSFIIFPAFIRNWAYDIVAKNRYKWYGKKNNCMIPTPKIKSKFL